MQWLTQFLDRILSWIPRIQLVGPDRGGVRLSLGRYVRTLSPGWYLWWPLIQECHVIPITPQVVDLRGQSVSTKDGFDIVISGAVMYRIVSPEKTILNVQDYDKSLQTLALGIIETFVEKKTLDECLDLDQLRREILEGIRESANIWGMKIMKIYITDKGSVRNIRVIGSPGVFPVEEFTDAGATTG